MSKSFRWVALLFVFALGLSMGCSASDADAPGDDSEGPPRMPIGKADAIGSCASEANVCGGKSSGNCWCDAECASHGDCCADSAACASWTVNDVSYLFPLPGPGQDKYLLRLDSKGARGELLPKKHYSAHIPYLWEGFYRELGYDWSRILAVRIDPCAAALDSTESSECRREVRLSAQPLWGDPTAAEPMTSAIDSALHLIYELDQKDFAAMLKDLAALKAKSGNEHGNEPLGPHPVMVRQGLTGPFAKGLEAIVLKYLGASNLVKFTAMTRGRNSTNWTFQQFEKHGDAYEATPIPATQDGLKQGVNELGLNGQSNSRDTIVSPVDPEIGYPAVLSKSSEVTSLPKADLVAALGRLAAIEDPGKRSNQTQDCASCHLTENARPFFEKLTGVKTPKALVTFAPPPGQNVTRVDETKLSGNVMRAFGYMDKQIAVSQRTINESARVANWLSSGGP